MYNKYRQYIAFKKISKELMSEILHPTGLWDWCMPEGSKKEMPFLLMKSSIKLLVLF